MDRLRGRVEHLALGLLSADRVGNTDVGDADAGDLIGQGQRGKAQAKQQGKPGQRGHDRHGGGP